MENVLNRKTIITNIIREPLLRNIFLACLSIAVAFPGYGVFFVYPSFTHFLIKSVEDDAIRIATHLSTVSIPEDTDLTKEYFSDHIVNRIDRHKRDFHLEKLKIFSKSGEIIYSTNSKDVGKINKERYFREIVAKGNVYTNVVKKDTTSLEGRMVTSDVVETYVPLKSDHKFNGAFEIYYDITNRKGNLDSLLSHSSWSLFIIASSLLIGVVIILFKASKTIIERSHAEDALRQTHAELERRVEERTAELAEANEKLRKEIAERKLIEKALRESGERLHILSSHLLTAQERERRRISLELHDELGQSLTVLKLQIRSIEGNLKTDQEALKENCESSLQYVDQIIENVRRLSRDLSPSILEDLGLTAALRWLVEDFSRHSNIKISLDLPDIDNLFSQDAQIIIYRIFQEAFTNIGRHAQATNVSGVIKKKEGGVDFLIEDDGKGFDLKKIEARIPTEKSLGLMAMDERAKMLGGELKIETKQSNGTRIIFRVPIQTD